MEDLTRVIYTLMKNLSGNRKYEFDEYIQWNQDEVDDGENRMISENNTTGQKKETLQTGVSETGTSEKETHNTFNLPGNEYSGISQLRNLLTRDDFLMEPELKEKYVRPDMDESKGSAAGVRLPIHKQCMKFERFVKNKV